MFWNKKEKVMVTEKDIKNMFHKKCEVCNNTILVGQYNEVLNNTGVRFISYHNRVDRDWEWNRSIPVESYGLNIYVCNEHAEDFQLTMDAKEYINREEELNKIDEKQKQYKIKLDKKIEELKSKNK